MPEQATASARVVGPSMSRRGFGGLIAVGGLAGFLGAAGSKRAMAAMAPPEVPADVDPASLMHLLVNRLSFGFTQAELAQANSLGYQSYLEYHLDHLNIPEDPVLTAHINSLTTINYTGQQLYDTTLVTNPNTVVNDLIEATFVRAVYSKRQLFERVVEFWGDHFNIDQTPEEIRQLKTLDDRSIRQYALTTFGQLLNASARSPAMMTYLDNDQSSSGSINENYARELMELHTVGADYLYSFPQVDSQATIVAVARCLTGWGWRTGAYNDTTSGGTGTALRGTFYYNSGVTRNVERIGTTNITGVLAGVHDTASKTLGTLFGSTVIPARTAAAGQQDGQDVLNLLIAHPATAAYIAKKMCKRFLGDGVPQSVIDSVRDTYLNPANPQGVGDIKAMLRTMLLPNNLAAAFPRFKRPFHLFASALRALPNTITTTSILRTTYMAKAGHTPFSWTSPDGFPDTTDYWTGQVLPRWSYNASLVTSTSGGAGGIAGITVDDATFFSGATTPAAVMDKLDQALFGGLMTAADKAAIQATLSATPTATQKRDAIGLALSTPAFQWY
jgi:uncharacterized protein (DUF1800 family)